MLIEIAIGDAYGAGFEYAPEPLVRAKNDLSGYIQHPRHCTRPGSYTDDTQMSIAIVEAMLSGQSWTRQLLADHFVRAFKRDPREGYASRFYAFLQEIHGGDAFLAHIRPDSEKSGAAMRACPVGLYPTVEDVKKRCTLQAALTHNTPAGVSAALAASLATHYCHSQLGPKRDLPAFLAGQLVVPLPLPWRGKVGHEGLSSAAAAITALVESDRMSDLLRACVAFTGDVDTVAAIALGAGSCCREIEQDLPQHLHDGLERGPYGYDFLAGLDERLTLWVTR
jgi:ADP-ribosylglycohydrolase